MDSFGTLNQNGDTLDFGDFKNGFGTLFDYNSKGRIEGSLFLVNGKLEGNSVAFRRGNRVLYIMPYHQDKAVSKFLFKRNGNLWRKIYFEEDGITVKKMEDLRWGKWTTYHPKEEQ
jgi:antitoxin component YwqK of YwqJK toxin-antitoxin module